MTAPAPPPTRAPLLGPACSTDAFDDYARAIALDLFVDPRGIQSLARYWVAVFADRPLQPMPAPSFCALLAHFSGIAAVGTGDKAAGAFDLALDGYETESRDLAFVARFFGADANLSVSYDFLVRAGREKTLCALTRALQSLSPPLSAPAATPRAFAQSTLAGLRGEFRVSSFCGNAMLAFYFNPVLFAAVATVEYVRALVLQPTITAHAPLVSGLLLPVAHALVEWGDPLLVDLSIALGQHDGQTPDQVRPCGNPGIPLTRHRRSMSRCARSSRPRWGMRARSTARSATRGAQRLAHLSPRAPPHPLSIPFAEAGNSGMYSRRTQSSCIRAAEVEGKGGISRERPCFAGGAEQAAIVRVDKPGPPRGEGTWAGCSIASERLPRHHVNEPRVFAARRRQRAVSMPRGSGDIVNG